MNNGKGKREILGFLFFFVITIGVPAGEWDYIPNINFSYYGIFTDQDFQAKISDGVSSLGHMLRNYHSIPKLPREVSQAMHNEIASYDLDVGDVFSFSCGYESLSRKPKAIVVFLRITRVDRDGTYNYSFYAWEHD